ncbi:MAG: protease PrsW [Candidatus Thermoplasmatota archaeon]|nr:protease PrsW [Candidatus Thermoplasmatota archaeon]
MDLLPQASLFLGVIPALIIMYISLKGYEGYYKDKIMFLTFIAGIIMGFIAAFVQSFTISLSIIFIIVLSFFDQLFKTIVLNLRRFQTKSETPIYGLSLGLGFGSSFTPFMIIATAAISTNNIYILTFITIGSVGIILFHGATGAYIGFGVFQGKLTRFLITSILLQLPFNLLLGLMISYSNIDTLNIQIIFVCLVIVYGLLSFFYVIKKVLPLIIIQIERRKRSKKSKV